MATIPTAASDASGPAVTVKGTPGWAEHQRAPARGWTDAGGRTPQPATSPRPRFSSSLCRAMPPRRRATADGWCPRQPSRPARNDRLSATSRQPTRAGTAGAGAELATRVNARFAPAPPRMAGTPVGARGIRLQIQVTTTVEATPAGILPGCNRPAGMHAPCTELIDTPGTEDDHTGRRPNGTSFVRPIVGGPAHRRRQRRTGHVRRPARSRTGQNMRSAFDGRVADTPVDP
jgi:hypothetical protein